MPKKVSVMSKTAGWVTEKKSTSTVLVKVQFTNDRGRETVSLEFSGTKITVPFHEIDRLKEIAREGITLEGETVFEPGILAE